MRPVSGGRGQGRLERELQSGAWICRRLLPREAPQLEAGLPAYWQPAAGVGDFTISIPTSRCGVVIAIERQGHARGAVHGVSRPCAGELIRLILQPPG